MAFGCGVDEHAWSRLVEKELPDTEIVNYDHARDAERPQPHDLAQVAPSQNNKEISG
jgi:hypothetical protein